MGAKVLKQHLLDYGRTDFLLSKLNDETFYLDFSKPKPNAPRCESAQQNLTCAFSELPYRHDDGN